MAKPLRILLVEDSEEDALLVKRALSVGGFADNTFHRVETAEAMDQALSHEKWDIIISDFSLPKFSGLAAFNLYKKKGLDLPFIIVSGTIGEEIAAATMKAGVHDYVMKGNLVRLTAAVERELREADIRKEARAAAEQLKRTERLMVVGELTSSLMHDLKNPLQVILASAEFLKESNIPSEQREKYGAMIERQIEQILANCSEILEFVKGDHHLALKPVNLPALIKELVESFAPIFAKDTIELVYSNDGGAADAQIIADEQKLWRLLQNLISNSRDAMPQGGRISLATKSMNETVAIEVSDTGCGIPDEVKASLFEPFVSHGKRHGTGLGLAIVKNIVTAHRGTVGFTAERGKGTSFRIILPRQPIEEFSQKKPQLINAV